MDAKSQHRADRQVSRWDLRSLRLPKVVEADPRGRNLLRVSTAHTRLLWPGGKIRVPTVAFRPALADALRNAHRAGHLVRGLEGAAHRLAVEDRGLSLVDQQSRVFREARVSRLLVLADDVAERFYRQVEKLLRQHGLRLLALCSGAKAEDLGQTLFGPGSRAALLLLDHKDATGAVLLSLIESPDGSVSCSEPANG